MDAIDRTRISSQVNTWIREEDFPPRSGLKVIGRFDDLYPQDEEEREAYFDFMDWAMSREHALIMSLPAKKTGSGFLPVQLDEHGNDISAFNTMDFQRLYPEQFNREEYAVKKVYEKVLDLAQTHCSISQADGKRRVLGRFMVEVEFAFRRQAKNLAMTLNSRAPNVNRSRLLIKLEELNERIRKCKSIWEANAFEG